MHNFVSSKVYVLIYTQNLSICINDKKKAEQNNPMPKLLF